MSPQGQTCHIILFHLVPIKLTIYKSHILRHANPWKTSTLSHIVSRTEHLVPAKSQEPEKTHTHTHTQLRVQCLACLISVIKSHKMKLVASLRPVKVTVTFRATERGREKECEQGKMKGFRSRQHEWIQNRNKWKIGNRLISGGACVCERDFVLFWMLVLKMCNSSYLLFFKIILYIKSFIHWPQKKLSSDWLAGLDFIKIFFLYQFIPIHTQDIMV